MSAFEQNGLARSETLENLCQLLSRAATDEGGRGILIYPPGDVATCRHLSYADLLETAKANAAVLPIIDGSPAKIMLLHFDNHFDNIEWFWSVVVAGYLPAISTPFTNDLEQRRKHIAHLKTLLKDPVALTSQRLVSEFDGVAGLKIECIEHIRQRKVDRWRAFPGFSSLPASNAVLMLTSGSTGNAKAVCLRHGQLIRSIMGKTEHHGTSASDVFLNWIGLDHVANLTESHLHAMLHASTQVHVQASDLLVYPQRFLELISKHEVTHSFAPNFFLASLTAVLEEEAPFALVEEPNLSHFRILISGGEANVVDTSRKMTVLLQRYKVPADIEIIRPGFGMTETCAGSIYNRKCPSYDVQHDLEFNSLGTCIPGLTMRITDDEGRPAAVDEPGSLELSGEVVFTEYFNNSEATAQAFTSDGWFITGDRALIDENGYLHLTGRLKESIIVNGVKHFPHELETAIESAKLPGVTPSYTAVFPHRPKGYQTETICIVYVPTYHHDDVLSRVSTTDALSRITTMQCGVKPYQVIPLEKYFLPKSSLGKMSRTKIRTAFEGGLYSKHQEQNDRIIQSYRATKRQAPSNEIEVTILRLFAELFGVAESDLGTNSSIFEMGISSIEIIKLKTRIQHSLHLTSEIPVITMMTNPTIKCLAAALTQMKEPKPYSPVVTLQAEGTKMPLWLVHPGVGEVLVFLHLAKYMVDRPVYALRARGFDEGETYFESITEIVRTYYAAIKEKQAVGPYAIAGYSFGAMLAFDIAKALESQGDEVPFLGVIDAPPNINSHMGQLDWTGVLLRLAHFLDLITEEYAHEISEDVHKLPKDAVLDFIVDKSRPDRMDEMALDNRKLANWADLAYSLQSIALYYEPTGK
ncbi:MAG: hypothetical protein Q9174_003924, partial [Haloplaca sp. 1 TL-2023]